MASERYTQEALQAAEQAGRDAYHAGVSIENNPYDSTFDGELHHYWAAGFLEAEEEDEVVLEEDEEFIEKLGDDNS